jgi:choline dehydrogenase-like flavoprotein
MAHFLNEPQYRTLVAICDALIPALPPPCADDAAGFWARPASALEVARYFTRQVRDSADPDQQQQFKLALDLLGRGLTAGALTGQWRPFADLDLAARERVLQSWAASPVPALRQLFQTFKRVASLLFYALPAPEGGDNPNWPALGYARRNAGPPPGGFHAPLRTVTIAAPTTLDCDVVIIGSGAGGGVAAGVLALAGHSVVVLERGRQVPEAEFTGDEGAGLAQHYETYTTTDGAMVVLAGALLGGGTTINWSASFRTPPHVLVEWAKDHGCSGLDGPDFVARLDAVSARLGVTLDESPLSPQSAALARGCAARGVHCAPVPRNAAGCGDPPACGSCGYGCSRGAKQSTVRTYLADAVAAGARLVVGATATEIILEAGRAVGVRAVTPDGQPLIVRAKAVIAAAGSLHGPGLLQRSGLTNPAIGRNLRLHPTSFVYGVYAEPIEPWIGVPIARYSSEWANLDGAHYGVMVEHPPAHPGFMGLALPWRSGRQAKALMQRVRHLAGFITLVRDRGAGQVLSGRGLRPQLRYALNTTDRAHLLRGLVEAIRLHAAAGAVEIGTSHSTLAPYRAGDDLEAYVQQVQRAGLAPNAYNLFSAHQMGTCRMGGQRAQAVVRPDGESWDVPGLFVADGSLFPTPTGVNPMLTIMALGHFVAGHVAARL